MNLQLARWAGSQFALSRFCNLASFPRLSVDRSVRRISFLRRLRTALSFFTLFSLLVAPSRATSGRFSPERAPIN